MQPPDSERCNNFGTTDGMDLDNGLATRKDKAHITRVPVSLADEICFDELFNHYTRVLGREN
jgi:hypothetical protein